MSVSVWRIAAETLAHSANDMTGAGAKISGGRWNYPGTPIIYCSSNIALAMLETLSYTGTLPFNQFLVRIDIPDTVWRKREMLSPHGGWDAVPSGMASRSAGDQWVFSVRSPY